MKKFLLFLSFLGVLSAQEIVSDGIVLVNGKPLTKETQINRGDTIETKANSQVRFNVGKDAFMAHSNAKFQLEKRGAKNILNVINGGVMAVFSKGNHAITTSNMTAGIRGTGTYTFVKDSKTYFCTCYGHTEVFGAGKKEELRAKHHHMVWVTENSIVPATTMQNHNDDELRQLESMVGRTPEFDN